MIKKISTIALAGVLCLPGLAAAGAGGDRIGDLEKQMTEMTKAFNAQMEAMKAEINTLKNQNQTLSKEVAANAETAKQAATTAEKSASAAEWTKNLSLGGQVTFRGYDLRNMWDFDSSNKSDNGNLFRTKGSIWADFKATDDVTARVKFTNQTWGELGGTDDSLENKGDKVFLDNAYINVRKMFGLPVEGTFGRQDVMYGSGFVVLDGQSQFASTSTYFDGVKLRWNITDQIMLDGLYLKSKENSMWNNAYNNSGDDQNLSGFYLTNKKCPITGMQQELYVLNRLDEKYKKDIWMYGIRLSDKLANGIDYSLEGAIQRGDAGMANGTGPVLKQDAWGTKLNAGYTFNVAWQPRPYLGYVYLSGDKSGTTDKSEQWDVFYGGWPQWGDLLAWKYLNLGATNKLSNVYSYNAFSTDTAEAAYSNFQMATIGFGVKPLDKLSVDLSYSKLTFNHTNAGVSDDFGDYYQTYIKYQYTKQMSFAFYGAVLAPGDAFNGTPKNNATEAYWEAEYKF